MSTIRVPSEYHPSTIRVPSEYHPSTIRVPSELSTDCHGVDGELSLEGSCYDLPSDRIYTPQHRVGTLNTRALLPIPQHVETIYTESLQRPAASVEHSTLHAVSVLLEGYCPVQSILTGHRTGIKRSRDQEIRDQEIKRSRDQEINRSRDQEIKRSRPGSECALLTGNALHRDNLTCIYWRAFDRVFGYDIPYGSRGCFV
jgi:hypothetical protein